jgi:hypothetical protein
VRLVLGSLFAFIIAAVVGLGVTYLTITRGLAFGGMTIGSWSAWPKKGTSDADPYVRATIARTGQLPMALGDGVGFTARTDDGGRKLDGRCDVIISGTTPPARFWTLTLYNNDGELVANSVDRYGFTSQEIVRDTDGSFQIEVAPHARTGNWLPSGGVEHYILVLRFYDTAVGVATRASREVPMPSIKTRSCG